MEAAKPNVFVINIHPENWEACVERHIFGLRKGTRHPVFRKGDVFLVRRTSPDYGVTGIWLFSAEEDITESRKIPWFGAEYTILLTYDPIVDFQTPMSEEFAGASKLSLKIQISAARLIGSVATIYEPEIIRYLEAILKEKADECQGEVIYKGEKVKVADVLNNLLGYYRKEGEKPPQITPTHDQIRDMLYEIGLMERRVSEREYRIDGERIDVAWKRIEAGNPYAVFEVQIGGNFYEALAKLKHAWDKWNSRPFLVTTEEYKERALQWIKGSFHEIEAEMKIIDCNKIKELYDAIKTAKGIEAELGIR